MMLTRCPTCSTAFRVTPEQLKARAGKVRCGHCNAVFNALEFLEDAPPPSEVTAVAPPAPPPEKHEAESFIEAPIEPAAPAAFQDTPLVADESGAEAVDAGSIDILLEDIGTTEAPPPSRKRAFAWAAAALFALGLLVIQAAYVFRGELALSQPGLRPQLEELCSQFGCDIPLPRKADLVGIEASDLHPDPQQKNLLVLAATLKNRAPFAQAYPHLELTLTDTRDQPMVRKVLAPTDYLAETTDLHAGFAANGELAVNLRLDAGDTGASGYRLYLFYP
jgi:predicted Zn finger-like uncharacterized protein